MRWDAKSDRLTFAKQNEYRIDIDNSQATKREVLRKSSSIYDPLGILGPVTKFIPKAAPWNCDWWERLVGLTKTTLKKVLGKSQVNSDVLRTILIENERVINDRPNTYVSSDIRDPEPLTPSPLLQGRRLSQENNSDSEDNNSNFDFTERRTNVTTIR
ncbi:unnamed protein product [Mytilus coruscus]|uniref:Uncharacterized protein n=1 Tax=Mytilus coruscus TaxID=42192 RepID=A0A6J8E5C2_MYTCO|nr:unnamed protein product [Mytilus coruscus]